MAARFIPALWYLKEICKPVDKTRRTENKVNTDLIFVHISFWFQLMSGRQSEKHYQAYSVGHMTSR